MEEFDRYNRQVILEEIGIEGQRKLAGSRAAIVGAGGLGSPVSYYLAAAGVVHLKIFDCKEVDITDLNRQILHYERDVGKSKTDSAFEKLSLLNSSIEITTVNQEITAENINLLLKDNDIIIDCLDNFSTRFILNEFCVKNQIPLIHGGVEGWRGQATTIIPGKSPCLRCIFTKAPEKKDIFPIIGPTAGLIGTIQASEAIKIITGAGETLQGKLLLVDMKSNSFETLKIKRNIDCPVCSRK